MRNFLKAIFLSLSISMSAQVPKSWSDLGDFNQHRIISTAMAWTGTIVGCKLAKDNQWAGVGIGAGVSLTIGILGKELIHDKIMKRGVASWKDVGGDLLGTAVGTVAGAMCNGMADHIRTKREVERAYRFYNPLK